MGGLWTEPWSPKHQEVREKSSRDVPVEEAEKEERGSPIRKSSGSSISRRMGNNTTSQPSGLRPLARIPTLSSFTPAGTSGSGPLILERRSLPLIAAAAAKLHQLCPTLWDPIGGSSPGSSVPGTLQARILEWVAISFSSARK